LSNLDSRQNNFGGKLTLARAWSLELMMALGCQLRDRCVARSGSISVAIGLIRLWRVGVMATDYDL
jgi:hypothetical protein